MARSPAARRYAKALFELAREQGKLDVVEADLSEIAKIFERRDDYMELLSPYQLSISDRTKTWRAVLGGKADPLVLRFVEFLVHKGRAQVLDEIIEKFSAFYQEHKGIVAVRIVSAHPLSDEQVAVLSKKFETQLGKKVKTALETDAALLGGFQVRVGDVVYDYSINHQLNLLHRKLISA